MQGFLCYHKSMFRSPVSWSVLALSCLLAACSVQPPGPGIPATLPYQLPEAGLVGSLDKPSTVTIDLPERFASFDAPDGMTSAQLLALRITPDFLSVCDRVVLPVESIADWSDCQSVLAQSNQAVFRWLRPASDDRSRGIYQALVRTPLRQFPVVIFSLPISVPNLATAEVTPGMLEAQVATLPEYRDFQAFIRGLRPAEGLETASEWSSIASQTHGVSFDVPIGLPVTEDTDGVRIGRRFSLTVSARDPRGQFADPRGECGSFLEQEVMVAGVRGKQYTCVQIRHGRTTVRVDLTAIVLKRQDAFYLIEADDVFTTLQDLEGRSVLDRLLGSLRLS